MIKSLLALFEDWLGPGYYHIIIEIGLVIAVYQLFSTRPKRPKGSSLTEKEKQQLIDEWQPEPLVPEYDSSEIHEQRTVLGNPGLKINLNGRECLNFGSYNFLSLLDHEDIRSAAKNGIKKYGVGSCGPRGFFGTFDAHLDLEKIIADFIGVEEAILYSYGFSTIASAIPAYSKTGDIIFVDEKACFAIQQGIKASKSKVRYYRHNDMDHLENLLAAQEQDDKKNPKAAKVTRKFIVAEALYMDTGELCPVPKLVEFKYKYKVRLFLEESNSFGVLGENGKGATEHFNIDPVDIDLIIAELERSLGSIGGFCAGTSFIIDHQRLSGAGYCFSASLPPYLARVAETAIQIMKQEPDRLSRLKNNCTYIHALLGDLVEKCDEHLKLTGHPESPVKHLIFDEFHELPKIITFCEKNGVALVQTKKVPSDNTFKQKSIRITIASDFTKNDLQKCVSTLTEIVTQIIPSSKI